MVASNNLWDHKLIIKENVLDVLDSDEILQFSLDKESKQTHWCWHSKNKNPKKKEINND